MIVAKTGYGDRFYDKYSRMPAYIQNGVLIIGHNGSSEQDRWFRNLIWYNSADFEYFCDHQYQGASRSIPQYLYKGKIPYELMRVVTGARQETLYTFLTPCRDNTYFCKCDDCGKNFVIDCYGAIFFKSKNLTLPTIRCGNCILKRKQEKNH